MNFDYCNGMIYVIQKGDTLYSISRKYNVPLALILRANPYADVYNLKIGDEICIPQQNIMPKYNMTGTIGQISRIGHSGNANVNSVMQSEQKDTIKSFMKSKKEEENKLQGQSAFPLQAVKQNKKNSVDKKAVPSPAETSVSYIVRYGDTIKKVLDYFNVPMDQFFQYNNIEKLLLKEGMIINIPNQLKEE